MAAAGLVGLGLLVFAATWLLSLGEEVPAALRGARRRLWARWVGARLARLGAISALGALWEWSALGEASSLVASRAWAREAGLGVEAARGVVLAFGAGVVVFGTLAAGAPGAVAAALLGGMGAHLWAEGRRRSRADEAARQVPDVFRSLATALGSGKTLSQAIAYVGSRGEGALGREFGRASLAVSCGSSPVEALGELAGRVEAPGVSLMVTALMVSSRTGAPLDALFMRSAQLVEQGFALRRELVTKTAQVRLSARIVCVLPAGLVAVLTLLSPDFREGVGTPAGAGCLAVASVLDVLALVSIRRLMRGVM